MCCTVFLLYEVSHTFCSVSSWWPLASMGGPLGRGWEGGLEEAEQLLTGLHLDQAACKYQRKKKSGFLI